MARFRGTSNNDTKRGIPTEENSFENFGVGSDTLYGGLKTDHFYLLADEQLDSINGYDGIDRLDYTNADRALRIDLSSGSVTAVLHNFTYTVAQVQNIEDATGSRYDAWAAVNQIAALRIAARFFDRSMDTKTFKRGMDAYNHPGFYRQLGKHPGQLTTAALQLLAMKFKLQRRTTAVVGSGWLVVFLMRATPYQLGEARAAAGQSMTTAY